MHTNPRLFSKLERLPLFIVIVMFAALAMTVQASAQKIILFDVQGAGTGAGQGTQAPGINPAGAITGFYWDDLSVAHGFVRDRWGNITTFDAPGAGSKTVTGFYPTAVGLGGQGTYGIAINPAGAIAGTYIDKGNVMHGFLRDPDGSFTRIDVPGAGSGFAEGTEADNVNSAGVVAGTYVDASGVSHGFVRDPDGRITKFDVEGAGTEGGQGTIVEWAQCLNDAGIITGNYVDASGVSHGFVRATDGKITKFDVEGAGTGAGQGTWSWSINLAGAVTAEYVDADNVSHGFVRAPDGKITKFDVPGAGKGAGQGTIGENINAVGVIDGNYIDASGVNHGYMRAPDGAITKFDVRGAGTGAGQGTIPLSNNASGATTGAYINDSNVLHGFVWMPN